MASLPPCCGRCCCDDANGTASPASLSSWSTDEAAISSPKLRRDRVMDGWGAQRSATAHRSSTSSVQGVHKKFSALESFDGGDDSVFAADLTSTILVLYCGGTIGMRTQHGGAAITLHCLITTYADAAMVIHGRIQKFALGASPLSTHPPPPGQSKT